MQTAAFLRDPAGFLIACRKRLGDCYSARFVGFPRLVYVARPDLVKLAFETDRGAGLAGAARAEFLEALTGENSLLTLDGERWTRQRRLLGPPFHGEAIESHRPRIERIAASHIERWSLGGPIRMRPLMQEITLEVILQVVFGIEESERLDRLRALLPELIHQGMWIVFVPRRLLGAMERLDRGRGALRRLNPLARLLDLRDEVDRLLYAEIAQRRAAADLHERTDILSVLLRARDERGEPMSDLELRDELITLLEAGHETTATGLAWVFERLARHPRAVERLRDELAVGESEYLRAVVRECLRLRPVVVDTARVLVEPLQIGGFELPAGWWIATAIPAVHTHPAVWERPQQFMPERFLDGGVPPNAWIPFGGGQRRCVGSRLALIEMEVVAAEVVRRLRLRPVDPRPEAGRLHHVTIVPAGQALLRAEPA